MTTEDVFARFRERRDRIAEPKRRVFNVPGYDGGLAVRCRVPGFPGIAAFANAVNDGGDMQVEEAARFIVEATVDVIVDGVDVGAWGPVEGEPGRVAAGFGVNAIVATEVVEHVIPLDVYRVQLAAEILEWANTEFGIATGEAVGE